MLLGKDDRRYISYWKSRGPTQPHPTPQTSLILSFIPFRRSIRMTHADNQYLHVQWTLWWWLISTATKGFLYFWIYSMASTFNPHGSLSIQWTLSMSIVQPSSSIAVVFMIYVSMVQTLFTLFPELTEWSVSWLFHHIIKELTFHDIVKVTFAAPQVQICLQNVSGCWKSKYQGELFRICDTFCRVWKAGGQAALSPGVWRRESKPLPPWVQTPSCAASPNPWGQDFRPNFISLDGFQTPPTKMSCTTPHHIPKYEILQKIELSL